jgi:hypothetical protein
MMPHYRHLFSAAPGAVIDVQTIQVNIREKSQKWPISGGPIPTAAWNSCAICTAIVLSWHLRIVPCDRLIIYEMHKGRGLNLKKHNKRK